MRPHAALTASSTCHHRRGTALLEAMVAVTILAVAGAWAVAMASQSAEAVRRARVADTETRQASAFLDAVALWPREDLDRHLGDRPEGRWVLTVERPGATLYVVVLSTRADGVAEPRPGRQLLQTVLYRRLPSDAAP
jgi:type II secretory pathway pseudopilin PulG